MKIRLRHYFLVVCSILLVLAVAGAAAAQLQIKDVDITSVGREDEAKPNELVTISFDVENDGEDRIEDIDATVYFDRSGKKMKDDNGKEIEFDFDLGYIKAGKTKTTEFSFYIPFDVEDGHVYDVVVEVDGKNESNRAKLEDTDSSESFTIIKDRHDLIFYRLDISPTTINCEGMLNVHYDIRDIGEKDEDANLSIVNSIFGINVEESFSLESDYDEDNKWEKSHVFDIPANIAPGIYGLTVTLVYDSGNKRQFNTTNIVVNACGAQQPSGSDQQATNQSQSDGAQSGTQNGQTAATVPVVQPSTQIVYPAATPKKSEGSSTTLILIIAAEVVVALLAIVIVLALRKRQ